jgi:hypothetical protein
MTPSGIGRLESGRIVGGERDVEFSTPAAPDNQHRPPARTVYANDSAR